MIDAELMTSAVRGVTRLSRTVEKVVAEYQLSLSQFRILDRLMDGVVGGRVLADWLAVKPPSITTLVDGLVRRGLVTRGVDPSDRRHVRHAVTPEGERLHAAIDTGIATRLREILEHVPDGDAAAPLIEALADWNGALDAARHARLARMSDRDGVAGRTRSVYADLGPLLGRHRRPLLIAVGLAVVSQLLLALLPLVQKVIFDDAIASDTRSPTIWIGLLLVIGVLSFVTNYGRRRVGGYTAVNVQRDLQIALHHHIQHLDMSRRDTLRAGDIMSRATSDISLIQMFLQQIALTAGNIALLAGSLAVMLALSPLLALLMLVCIPLFLWVSLRFRERSFPASWMDQRYNGAVAGTVEEAITGVRIVKAFGQEQHELDRLVAEAGQLYQSRVRTAWITARYTATLRAIPALGQLGVLAIGGWLAMTGHITLGTLLAFSTYIVQLIAPVRVLTAFVATSQQAKAGAHRVSELLKIDSDVVDRPDSRPLEGLRGEVSLDDVSFGYTDGPSVLRDVSVHVRPGERIAIVGASGAGKSTLAMLLARFYDPTSGVVRIDGTDVRDVTLTSLRQAVTIVFEDTFLFSTSIRDNIAFGRPDATTDEIERAAVAAHAHGFICGLPDGYDTVVGERGFTLSGGQRQRIALARAALVNPKVLVLDDATSAVDAHTEAAIHRSFDEIMAERTTVLIAHRASTLRLVDRVLILDGGRIVAAGTTDELMSDSELLRELLAGPEVHEALELARPVGEIDPDAWPTSVSRDGAARISGRSGGLLQSASGGRGTSMAAMTSHLALLTTESPELIAAAEQLPPLRGEPDVDLETVTAPEDRFSFRKVLQPFVWPLLIGAGLVVIDTITMLLGPLLIRRGIDSGVVADSAHALRVACALFFAVQLVSFVNAIWMHFQTSRTAERVLFSLRVRTFAHLQRLSLDFYDQHMAGRIMTRMTSDIDAFAQLVQQGLLTALVSVLSCVGIAVVLVVLSPSLAATVAVVVPPLVVGTVWFRRVSARNYTSARERLATLYADMQESLSGVRVSQAFAQQPANEARFVALADSYNAARQRSVEMIARFFPFIQLMSIVAKAIALAVGGRQVAAGDLSSGVLIAFLLYLDQLFTPIQQLSNVFDQWLQAKVAVTQLTELLRTPTATPQARDPMAPGRLTGHICFRDVEFAYPSTRLVALHTMDLDIPAGQVVALVGTTGAGKSTIVKLVARFYDPSAGEVRVDGMPLHELDLPAYRHQLGYVPQEPFLFSGTIRSNIAYGRHDASDLEVERAARAVGAHDFVVRLPFGYHTPVSEEGRSMSAGQRQLLGLARAHLVDPAILLLDEATANLDLATEARVQAAMGLVARGRTTLLIAHRLQTARAAQRILVIDEGRVVEDGSHEDLLELGGRYAELWEAFRRSAPAH